MRTWLKLIGSAKKPITVLDNEYVGFRKKGMPGIRAGDQLFLYAPGGSRRIFALAEASSDPEQDPDYKPDEEGSCRWKVRVKYLYNGPVTSGILIDDIICSQRDLKKSIGQQSHIKLFPEEADTAKRKLEAAHTGQPRKGQDAETDAVLAEEILQHSCLVEGAVRSITVNAYERNPQARRQCIDVHGTTCCICGFSFGAVYGKVADGYIHVHHLRPLSEIKGAYVVDPVKDLRPVCPNCHAILHRGGESRSIEEVRRMVDDNRA